MASVAGRPVDEQFGREKPESSKGSSRSGRLLLRMPSELHDELSRLAEREGVSLNQLIVKTLSESLDGPVRLDMPLPPPKPSWRERFLGFALVANIVVVALAGVAALVLIVAAWDAGF
jgi:HicB family